jgi:DNA polymerase/3'-5' exonuclease PolX
MISLTAHKKAANQPFNRRITPDINLHLVAPNQPFNRRITPDINLHLVTPNQPFNRRIAPNINLYDRYFRKDQKNELIIQKFTELLDAIEIQKLMSDDKDEKRSHDFRLFSVRRALNRIRQIPEPIVNGESLLHIHGIGDGIVTRINEILLTGDLSELKQIVASPEVKIILELKTVHGLGETLAKKLFLQHNVRSVKELRIRTGTTSYNADKIDDPEVLLYLKKPPIEITALARLGLIYYDDIMQRIPREEISETYEIIKEILFRKDPQIISECCGSYRRGKESSGDIDIIFCHPDIITDDDMQGQSLLSYLLEELQKMGRLEVTLNGSLTRFQGLIRTARNNVRRSDIFWVPYDSYYPSLIYLTGSDIFNRLCRCIAHRKGYTMSNWGLYPFVDSDDKTIRKIKRNKSQEPDVNFETMKTDPHAPTKYVTGSKILLRSEEEIFKLLEIEWLPPHKRT